MRKNVVYSRHHDLGLPDRTDRRAGDDRGGGRRCCRSTGHRALFSFSGDLVAFAGLLGLGRFALVLAGLDTGSSFEGMGASREVTVAAFAEPALLLCFTVLVLATGELSLAGHARRAAGGGLVGRGALAGRSPPPPCSSWRWRRPPGCPSMIPVTHLELTMIHEVIVLDHSGPELAMILFGNAVKLALFGALVVSVLVPRGQLPPWLAPIWSCSAGLVLVAVARRRGRIEHGASAHEPDAAVPGRGRRACRLRRHPAAEVSDVRICMSCCCCAWCSPTSGCWAPRG